MEVLWVRLSSVQRGVFIAALGCLTVLGVSRVDASPQPLSKAAVFQKTLAGSLTVIAKQGDPVPGTTTGFFTSFDDIAENNNDDVVYLGGYVEGGVSKWGVFLAQSGGATVPIVLEGDALPTGCGTFSSQPKAGFANFPDGPWVNDSKAVAFQTDADCGSGTVFLKKFMMPIQLFIVEGEPAPGSLGNIQGINAGRPSLNNSFTMGFRAGLDGTIQSALLTKTAGGTPALCVQEGDNAPGTSGTFEGFAENPAINQGGRLFVQASIKDDPNVTQGIFTCLGGAVQKIALEGEAEPGTTSNFCDSIEEGSLSDDGRVTFLNECTPNGVFVTGAGGTPVTAVALEGDTAPGTNGDKFGPNARFDVGFDEPFVNTTGDVTFGGNYPTGSGIFLRSGTTVSAIAVSGQVVPGIGPLSTDFDGPAFNNNSTVAFVNRPFPIVTTPVLTTGSLLGVGAALFGFGYLLIRRRRAS